MLRETLLGANKIPLPLRAGSAPCGNNLAVVKSDGGIQNMMGRSFCRNALGLGIVALRFVVEPALIQTQGTRSARSNAGF